MISLFYETRPCKSDFHSKKIPPLRNLFWTRGLQPFSVHADLHALVLVRNRTVETHLDFIEVDMHDFLTIRTNFRNLSVKINRVSTHRATCNYNTDDLCFLLHDVAVLSRKIKMMKSNRLGGFLLSNISIFLENPTLSELKKFIPFFSFLFRQLLLFSPTALRSVMNLNVRQTI